MGQIQPLRRLRKLVLSTHSHRQRHTFEAAKRFEDARLAALPHHLESIELDHAALPFEVILGLLISPGRDTCLIKWTEDPFSPKQRKQMAQMVDKDNAFRKGYLSPA